MNVKNKQCGFSMIEVLVAATIMIMIVMMLGMIFQQSSQAWRTGKHRADIYQQVRAIFGAIQRDASMAVDQNSLPKSLFEGANAPLSENQVFSGDTLLFYTLTGTGFEDGADAQSGRMPLRSLRLVKYSGQGQRAITEFVPVASGGYEARPGASTTIVNPSLRGMSVQLSGFTAENDLRGGAVAVNPFPAYVTVSAGVVVDAVSSYDVGAASGGPDETIGKGKGDIRSRDDIKTWVE